MMRWYVLRTLLHKELLRLLNNRGGLAMAAVIVLASVLAAAFGDASLSPTMVTGKTTCVVDHWEEGPWIDHLRAHIPDHLKGRVTFRSLAGKSGMIGYPRGTVGIQIRPSPGGEAAEPDTESPARYAVWVWHPDPDGAEAAPFEIWFWRQSRRYFRELAEAPPQEGAKADDAAATKRDEAFAAPDARWWSDAHRHFRERLGADLERAGLERNLSAVPVIDVARSRLIDRRVNLRAGAAMFLVLMALFFVCIFLMPSATAEERERGALLAQALSPASSLEILGAKLLFYPTLAVGLASLVAGICRPSAWTRPFFWLALGITALGTVGIGLTLSVLARTQRAASMSALSYMLAVALILIICRANGFEIPAAFMLEYHGPAMLLAALDDAVRPAHWGQLAISWVLAVVWCGLATALFRRFGWQ